LCGDVKRKHIVDSLNKHLPKGLDVLTCQIASTKSVSKKLRTATYLVTKKDGVFDEKDLDCFLNDREIIVTRTGPRSKTKKIDLKKMVLKIELSAPNRLKMTLKTEPGKTVRPFEVMEKIFRMPVEEIKQATVVKM
jgi:radical SAM-linked protein